MLPVKFARESARRKITLVICKDVPEVQTLWALLDVQDIATTRQKLGLREYEAAKPKWVEVNIALWDKSSGFSHGEGAEEYVRKAPHQLSTAYRELIITALGWI